jgi:hypothetical protein
MAPPVPLLLDVVLVAAAAPPLEVALAPPPPLPPSAGSPGGESVLLAPHAASTRPRQKGAELDEKRRDGRMAISPRDARTLSSFFREEVCG